MHLIWRNICLAFAAVAALWTLGAFVLVAVSRADTLPAWTTAACFTFAVAVASEFGKSTVVLGPNSPIKSAAVSFLIRSVSVLGILLLVGSMANPPAWLGSIPTLAVSLVPFYLALLAVEIFAARPILIARAKSHPPQSHTLPTH